MSAPHHAQACNLHWVKTQQMSLVLRAIVHSDEASTAAQAMPLEPRLQAHSRTLLTF